MFRRRAVSPEIAAANRRSFVLALAVVGAFFVWLVFASAMRDTSTVASVAEPSPSSQLGRPTVRETSIACIDADDLSRLARYKVDNDPVALKRAAAALILSDRCTMLQPGEAVILVKAGLISNKVRRPGDLAEYWVARERVK